MSKKKNILICPLDWGLGHATRLVPIIDECTKKGAKVIIGADYGPLYFLKQRFPNLTFVKFPGFVPSYPENGSMAFAMIKSYPRMISEAKKAKRHLKNLISEYDIDIIISDNRYELSAPYVYSVFITHQLNIQTPGFSSIAKPFITSNINRYIKKYNELWIPDYEGEENLSGELSHSPNIPNGNFHFIGPLSRFSLTNPKPGVDCLDLLILLSGPEPQRTLLEQMLIQQVSKTDLKTIILQGKPEYKDTFEIKNVKLVPHLPDDELIALINNAGQIICRPGYSTIMDLAVIGKKAIFVPTPGQTEQDYLAKHYHELGICYSVRQSQFKLTEALEKNKLFKGFVPNLNTNGVQNIVNKLIAKEL